MTVPSNRNAGHVCGVILCDDVRQEKNNKYILIGVFSGNVVMPEFPAAMAPQSYIQYMPNETGTREFTLRFHVDGEQRSELKGTLNVHTLGNPENIVVLVTPPTLIEFQKPGTLELQFQLGDSPPETILTKEVILGGASTSAPQPPSEQSQPAAPS